MSRRLFLSSLGAAAGGAVGLLLAKRYARSDPAPLPRAPATVRPARTHDLRFRAAERTVRLLGEGGPKAKLWTYTEEPFPVLRIHRGDRLLATLDNALPEHTSIHWHGIRGPNAMDGVQYVTQPPVRPGERFRYDLTPPDTGTFFFHPHCNEAGQVGQGLAGVLLVEGDAQEPFDAEVVLIAKDWRLKPDGTFLPFVTDRGASRAGTFGTVRSVNGQRSVAEAAPAGADVRIRILNLDSTRIMEVGVEGGPAAILAVDGNPIPPLPLDTWRMGPAMRLDIVARTPAEGSALKVIDYFAAEPFMLAELKSAGPARRSGPFAPQPLYASAIPEPDLGAAEQQTYALGAASEALQALIDSFDPADPLSNAALDSLCVGRRTFWAINKQSWPNDSHRKLPPPLARLTAGRSYRFTLQNATPHPHPIHLHGHTFKVLSSSRRNFPPYYADTVLLDAKERVEIAFVAREGSWMFHCHSLEHIETGMMGYFRIA
jgi:FtsP/CotA-like multicopper oxidase with cupredoxin domain